MRESISRVDNEGLQQLLKVREAGSNASSRVNDLVAACVSTDSAVAALVVR